MRLIRQRVSTGFLLVLGVIPGSIAASTRSLGAADDPQVDLKPYVESIPGTDVKFEMIPIPAGTFELGSPATEAKRRDDEGPVRRVKIEPLWMGKYEVTWDEFDLFAFSLDIKRRAENPAAKDENEKLVDAVTRPTKPYADMTFGLGHSGNPAICMTHHAAMEYCRWLSAKTGKVYRLPTEAEWEYACRAGSKTAYCFGDDPARLGDYGWFVENAEKPMKVGKKKPNAWGIYDMHGNVAEWCVDLYKPNAYELIPADRVPLDPFVAPTPDEYPYTARGGSWDDDADRLRSAARRSSDKEWSMQDPQRPQSIWWHTDATFVGFRVVRAAVEPENLKGVRSLVVKKKGSR